MITTGRNVRAVVHIAPPEPHIGAKVACTVERVACDQYLIRVQSPDGLCTLLQEYSCYVAALLRGSQPVG